MPIVGFGFLIVDVVSTELHIVMCGAELFQLTKIFQKGQPSSIVQFKRVGRDGPHSSSYTSILKSRYVRMSKEMTSKELFDVVSMDDAP